MTCILRVGGEDLNIDALLKTVNLEPDRVWHKGEVRNSRGRLNDNSGATFVASPADFNEFEEQVKDATQYLELHLEPIRRIVAFPGVEWAVLDFGIELREGFFAHNDHLPSHFLRAAGLTGIDVELSHYLCNDEKGANQAL